MTPKQVLKECRLFEALSDADLGKVANLAVTKEYEAGATVFTERSLADELYVLERGKVALQMQLLLAQPQLSKRVTVDVAGKDELIGCIGPGGASSIYPDGSVPGGHPGLGHRRRQAQALLQADQHMGYNVLSRLITVVASRLDETRHVLISERLVSTQA